MSTAEDRAFIAQIGRQVSEAIAGLRAGRPDDAITAEVPNAFCQSLLDRLVRQTSDPRLQQVTIRSVSKELDAAAATSRLPFPRRRLVRPPRPSAPLRRSGWQQDAQFAFACWDHLHAHLDRRCRDLRDEDLAGVLLASAILRGGLLRPAAWPALLTALGQRDLTLHTTSALPDLPWIDLDLPLVPKAATNHSPNTARLRFFPDVVTLGLLRHWQRRDCKLTEPVNSPRAALGLMIHALFEGDLQECPDADRFAAAAMAPLEDQMDLPLPYLLAAVASGAVTGFSASDESWWSLHGAGPADRTMVASTRRRKGAGMASSSTTATPSSTWAALQQALTMRPEGAQKQTRGPVEAALNALSREDLTPAGHALRVWYLSLLQARRAVSTLQRYHADIARPLLALCQDQDPATWEVGRLEEMVALALSSDAGIATAFVIARLMQFCGFAAQNAALRWPEIDPAIAPGYGAERHPRVRTALISASQISEALRRWPTTGSGDLRDVERVGFLLAARGGLRLSELEALTVGDVIAGADGAVLVHSTLWADIKSSAGRRKVPVQMLATGDEARLIESFFVRRIREAASRKDQLLSLPRGLFGSPRFDREGFFANLRQVTGLTPHDLRHAAISNLGLLLMTRSAPGSLLSRLTGWPAAQQKQILTGLLGARPDARRGLTQLARIAGHARPETTLRSYIHLADLALGVILRANPESLPAERAARWLGLNRRTMAGKKPHHPANLEKSRKIILQSMTIRHLKTQSPPSAKGSVLGVTDKITPELTLRLLQARDRSTPLQDLAERYDLTHPQLRNVETMAKHLQPPGRASCLTPTLPRRLPDREFCQLVMLRLAGRPPEDALAWSIQTLRAARAADLVFATRLQFEGWQATMGNLLCDLDWHLSPRAGKLRAKPCHVDPGAPLSIISLTAPAKLMLCAWAADQSEAKRRAILATLRA
ncbi:site-specific integrase [Paracoccus sp. JM45]|uniref:site-specific integrase n=1 Tax=Paracoccus sp. JM45 TaxID=2283626 RepID=UPI000E6BFE14|nr:site-specific integrase [Paracoccus sp. JM45]RJE79122.1 hypothetical protein DWB67_13740 [Paracoccus sp. JM45]